MATGRIGTTPVLTTRWSKAPAAGTTSLSGLDDNSVSLVYSVGYEQVYLNGALLSRTNDYTATNGTTITLTNATVAGDIVEVIANATIALTDTYTQSQANGKFINNTLTTTTGDIIYASAANTPARLGIGSTDQVLKVSSGIPAWGAAPSPTVVGFVCTPQPQYVNISNNTQTAIAFDSTDYLDTDNFHNPSSQNDRITIPTGLGGKYLISVGVQWNGQTSGYVDVMLYKNTSLQFTFRWEGAGSVSQDIQIGGTQILDVAAGDYLRVEIYQTSGGTVGFWGLNNGGGRSTFISGYRLGA